MDKNFKLLGEFLGHLLNLELTAEKVRGYLDRCNEIIPIANLEDCKRLIVSPHERKEMEKAYASLPTEAEKERGTFYQKESFHYPNGMSIGLDYATVTITSKNKSEVVINYDVVVESLFEQLADMKTQLASLIDSMTASANVSDLIITSAPIKHSIEKVFDHDELWDLEFEYVRRCVFNAFFEFFSEKGNINRIKPCPICKQFFVADDLKKEICYSNDCKKIHDREYHRNDMRKRRDPDSDKFDPKYV